MLNGLCTGVGLRDGVLNFEMRSSDNKSLVAVEAGDGITLAIDGPRCCIGYRPPEAKSLIPCPDDCQDISSSQCPSCFEGAKILPCLRCTGERCTNPDRRQSCVSPGNHAVYLAAFAPDLIKVGVARWNRRQERLAEQGAISGLVIARDDGQQVRRVEAQIRRTGIPDRIAPTIKLQALTQKYSESELTAVLEKATLHLRHRIRAQWLDEAEVVSMPIPVLRSQAPRLLAPHAGLALRGEVGEIIGRTLMIDADVGETVALEAQSLIGYNLRSFAEGEEAIGQMAFSFGD